MTTAQGLRLTEAHRLLQAKIGARATTQMIAAWRLLDVANLDATVARWLSVAMPAVQGQRAESAATAATYLRVLRVVEVGDPFEPVLAAPAPVDKLATSLTVTGPISLKSALSRGVPLERATDLALAGVARAAMRHTLDGGRDTVTATVAADAHARGWERVTSTKACKFCASLAGKLFSEDGVTFDSHDGCQCAGSPVYSR